MARWPLSIAVLDLNVVQDPIVFPALATRARKAGGALMLSPAHLSELFKDAATWRSAVSDHLACLRFASDLVVMARPTEELFVDELQSGRPARNLISKPGTRGLQRMLAAIRRPDDVDIFFGANAGAMRTDLLRLHLNADRAKEAALEGLAFMDKAASREEWSRISQGDHDLLARIVAEVALEALCNHGELARLDRTQFTDYVTNSAHFKHLSARILLDCTYRAQGLNSQARSDKLLNSLLDLYVVSYGAAAGRIASEDGKVHERFSLLKTVVRFARALATNDWDRFHKLLQEAPKEARALEARRRLNQQRRSLC